MNLPSAACAGENELVYGQVARPKASGKDLASSETGSGAVCLHWGGGGGWSHRWVQEDCPSSVHCKLQSPPILPAFWLLQLPFKLLSYCSVATAFLRIWAWGRSCRESAYIPWFGVFLKGFWCGANIVACSAQQLSVGLSPAGGKEAM